MSIKVLDVDEFLKMLIDNTTPEYAKAHKDWFMKMADKITNYGIQLAIDAGLPDPKVDANLDMKSSKLYSEICDELLYKLPSKAEDKQQIEQLKEANQSLCVAVLHFMAKYPVDGNYLTITHEDIDSAKSFAGVAVSLCNEHGVHVHAIPVGEAPNNHVH